MKISDEMTDTAIRAGMPKASATYDPVYQAFDMRAALEAVAPMIRAEAFEEAAKVADGFVEAASKALADPATPDNMRAQYQARWAAGVDAASAIRAMVERG